MFEQMYPLAWRGLAGDGKSDPANHTNHEEHQKSPNSTDLLSHNNVGISNFK